jgi:signal transduction histidine kinase
LALIDRLASYIEEIVQQRAGVVHYLNEHRSEVGDVIINKFIERSKKSDGECQYNLWRLGRIRQDIQQSRKNSLIDINASVQEASAPYKESERVELQLQLASDMPTVAGSSIKVSYIWTNLFRNSIDAIGEAFGRDKTKKGRLGVKTQTVIKDDKKYIEVSVSDNGAGIPVELLQQGRLFQKGMTTKQYGNGLGLYLIKQTVEELGGTIDVQSEVGKGTTFTVRLPVDKAQAANSAQKGGIDLTRDKMGLKVQGAGDGVQFNFDPVMIQQLQNASGLTPVVIDIHPMATTVPMFLGIKEDPAPSELVFK